MSSHRDDVGIELGEMEGDLQRKSEGLPLAKHPDAADSVNDDLITRRNPRSNWIQRITAIVVIVIVGLLIVVIGVTSATFDKIGYLPSNTYVTTVYQSLGLPGYEGYSWNDVVSESSGHTVNFWSYGDAANYNAWIDGWLAKELLDQYDITLVRHPINATVDAVNQVIAQSKSSPTTGGNVDLIWINGANFATLKQGGYAYGPWSTKVPNSANFDFNSIAIAYDFGLPINGYEMPYNEAQCIFIYNNNTVISSSVENIDRIKTWIKSNPGRFTYAAPAYDTSSGAIGSDYTGSVFIRHIFYSIASPYTQFLGSTSVDQSLYLKYAPTFYKYLRSIEPYLYNATHSVSGDAFANGIYPIDNDDVDTLFGQGRVWLTLSYDVGHATNKIQNGKWPSTTSALVLTSGTIANTNYVVIPKNSANKLAAMVSYCHSNHRYLMMMMIMRDVGMMVIMMMI